MHLKYQVYHFIGEKKGQKPLHHLCPYIGLIQDRKTQARYVVTNGRHKRSRDEQPNKVQKRFIAFLEEDKKLKIIFPYGCGNKRERVIILGNTNNSDEILMNAEIYRHSLSKIYKSLDE